MDDLFLFYCHVIVLSLLFALVYFLCPSFIQVALSALFAHNSNDCKNEETSIEW